MIATKTDVKTFRGEVTTWLEENYPASLRQPISSYKDFFWGGRNQEDVTDDLKLWFNRCYEKGWVVPHWEKKYGGGGLTLKENTIIAEEMSKIGARAPLQSFGVSMLGPALLKFGSEEQKMKYLNEITSGKIRWVQGYSEPGAGSDLAGLQTKAEDKGDHYLVNGQKIWTSFGDKGDWIFALVRTHPDRPKHHGISFLLIDMATEGVSTRPIKLISGVSVFTETFFDNVKVPKENLVGTEGEGWTIAKYLLTHERQMIGGIGDAHKPTPLTQIAGEKVGLTNGILSDTLLRSKIMNFEMNEALLEMTIERAIDEAKAGNDAGALSSLFKYVATEQNKTRYELKMEMEGFDGLEWESEASKNGALPREFLRTKANTIEGGTSEVMLNIISKRILGLPSR
ncbi:MAG: acyl-CoA dehydrogenase family protein [Bacteroidetes bacterium]|jgi:alkylation response protein AidB-like acyl-CoA dehydrogenase|nr:acyl-CoA dehydrogenase family protein [Bacteroidota bacterium]MDF1863641.1 acyl-CoA dehydrogenase family protein [Saprospiraceae bacterium]